MKPLHTKLRPALRRLAKCLSDRKGSIFVVVGAGLPVLIGVLGLGADAGIWYANKRAAQTQTDAAAISGAFEKSRFNSNEAIVGAARKEAARNGFTNTLPNTLTVLNPPTSGALAGNPKAVEVIMNTQQSLMFAKFFIDNVAIKTRAVASVQTTGTACVLALDPTASNALSNSGSVVVNMPGCVMASNSSSNSAINLTGSAQITADSLWTAGNFAAGGSAGVNLTRPPTVKAWPIDDPYASIPLPIPTGPNLTYVGSKTGQTIQPGIYPSMSIGSQDIVTFAAGTYYINGGDFTVQGGAVIRCDCTGTSGVTIVLTSPTASTNPSSIGTVTINAGADVQLKAPSDGVSTYSGLAFYQDPRASVGSPVAKFNGGATQSIQGAVYFPNRTVQWNGNNTPSAPSCTQVIGRTVQFNGNATINNTGCKEAGVEPITISGVRVVE